VKDESHKEAMREAVRGDFRRLRERQMQKATDVRSRESRTAEGRIVLTPPPRRVPPAEAKRIVEQPPAPDAGRPD
jgi:hypothetical protein